MCAIGRATSEQEVGILLWGVKSRIPECVQLPSVAVSISCDMSAPQKRSVFRATVWVLEFPRNEITVVVEFFPAKSEQIWT